MLETKLSLPFYGHVRQYHNIKAEMDAKIQEDLESGQSVMGRCGRARQPPPIAAVPDAVGIPPPEGTVPISPRLGRQELTPGLRPRTCFRDRRAIWITGATVTFVDSEPRAAATREGLRRRAQSRGHLGESPDAVGIGGEREGIGTSRPPRPFLRTRKFRGPSGPVDPQRIHGPGGIFLIHCCSFPRGGQRRTCA